VAELSHPIFVVCPIDEEIGTDILESPVMLDMEKCRLDSRFLQSEKYTCLIGDSRILELMSTEEIGLYISFCREDHWSIPLHRYIFECQIVSIEDHRDSWLDDTSFLRGDRLQSIPEVLHMIVGDTRDDREDRSDDIGRIESSSHPYLEDDILAFLITEVEKSEQYTFLIVREIVPILDDLSSIENKFGFGDEISVIVQFLSFRPKR
jgi:hypothetical protein